MVLIVHGCGGLGFCCLVVSFQTLQTYSERIIQIEQNNQKLNTNGLWFL